MKRKDSVGYAMHCICLKSVLFSRKEGDSCLLAWRILCRVVGSIGWPKMRKYSFCTPIEGAWHVSFLFCVPSAQGVIGCTRENPGKLGRLEVHAA